MLTPQLNAAQTCTGTHGFGLGWIAFLLPSSWVGLGQGRHFTHLPTGFGACLLPAHSVPLLRPDLVDFSKLTKSNANYNLQRAFRTAEQHLGLARLLDPEGKPGMAPAQISSGGTPVPSHTQPHPPATLAFPVPAPFQPLPFLISNPTPFPSLRPSLSPSLSPTQLHL